MRQCGPVTFNDVMEVFFVKAALVVWMFVSVDQGSIITDEAPNEGRFAGERPSPSRPPKKSGHGHSAFRIASHICWSLAIMSSFSESANDGQMEFSCTPGMRCMTEKSSLES